METDRYRWVIVAALAAIAYALIGIAFPTSFARASSHFALVAWRLAAWLASGVVFLGHFTYEYRKRRSSRLGVAGHISVAVALGAFLLAISILVHSLQQGSGLPMVVLALVILPLGTGVPAFFVAWLGSTLLDRLRTGHWKSGKFGGG